jgi:hypothetical protein
MPDPDELAVAIREHLGKTWESAFMAISVDVERNPASEVWTLVMRTDEVPGARDKLRQAYAHVRHGLMSGEVLEGRPVKVTVQQTEIRYDGRRAVVRMDAVFSLSS